MKLCIAVSLAGVVLASWAGVGLATAPETQNAPPHPKAERGSSVQPLGVSVTPNVRVIVGAAVAR